MESTVAIPEAALSTVPDAPTLKPTPPPLVQNERCVTVQDRHEDSSRKSVVKPSFRQVLVLLAETHDQEMAALRVENTSLRDCLCQNGSAEVPGMPDGGSKPNPTPTFNTRNLAATQGERGSMQICRMDSMATLGDASVPVSGGVRFDIGGTRKTLEAGCDKRMTLAGRRSMLAQATSPGERSGNSVVDTQLLLKSRASMSLQGPRSGRGPGGQSRITWFKKPCSRQVKTCVTNFVTWPTWNPDTDDHALRKKYEQETSQHRTREIISRTETELVLMEETCMQSLIFHPGSFVRLLWDLFGMAVLGYDLVYIPFVLTFEPANSLYMSVMAFGTMIFWTLDILISFFTGYHSNEGLIVLQPIKVALNYMKTGFLLDLCIVGLDYVLLGIDGSGGEVSKVGRSLKVLRVLRTLRLLRLIKLKHILQQIQDRISSEAVSIYYTIIKMVFGLVVANHLIACGFFLLSISWDRDISPDNWVNANQMLERTIAYRYSTSLHWSLTQFTPASMEVRPYNVGERIYSVVVLLFALITFSSVVSTITGSMTKLRSLTSNESRMFWLLRRYLKQAHVSTPVSMKVQRFLEYTYARQLKRIAEKDVEILTLLSKPLRDELKCESFKPHITTHPLFHYVVRHTVVFMNAVKAMSFARGDLMFSYQEQAEEMCFVVDGKLEYWFGEQRVEKQATNDSDSKNDHRSTMKSMKAARSSGGGSGQDPSMSSGTLATREQDAESVPEMLGSEHHEDDDESEDDVAADPDAAIMEGEWICESVLWTSWVHLGDLQALTECQLIVISSLPFRQAVMNNRGLCALMRQYGQAFVSELNAIPKDELTDMVDRELQTEHMLAMCKVPGELLQVGNRGVRGMRSVFVKQIFGGSINSGSRKGGDTSRDNSRVHPQQNFDRISPA